MVLENLQQFSDKMVSVTWIDNDGEWITEEGKVVDIDEVFVNVQYINRQGKSGISRINLNDLRDICQV